jgi:hypothetical protein
MVRRPPRSGAPWRSPGRHRSGDQDDIQNGRLWIKRRGQPIPLLAGTERASNPVFSPDGEWVVQRRRRLEDRPTAARPSPIGRRPLRRRGLARRRYPDLRRGGPERPVTRQRRGRRQHGRTAGLRARGPRHRVADGVTRFPRRAVHGVQLGVRDDGRARARPAHRPAAGPARGRRDRVVPADRAPALRTAGRRGAGRSSIRLAEIGRRCPCWRVCS